MDEVEHGEKDSQAEGISWGLENADDTDLADWIGQIVGPPNVRPSVLCYHLVLYDGLL